MKLSDFDVLSFDCYGTLIDWESGICSALAPLVSRANVGRSRDAVLEAWGRNFNHLPARASRALPLRLDGGFADREA
jgi:FMN phosphatase YigB (HAD superfamily)